MISIFKLWTFHLYVITFQHHLHMEYKYLSWSDILVLLVPIMNSLIALLQRSKLLKQGFLMVKLKSSFESFMVATMTTSLTVTEYLCHKWKQMCSVCHNHSSVLSSFMTNHWVCNAIGATSGTETAYHSGVPEFTSGFCGVRVARSLVLWVMFYRSLFVLSIFFWPLCFFILFLFTTSNYYLPLLITIYHF